MRQPVFALVDCNSFYCSCERLFAPHLEGRPVVVLSNNDGCIVSRTAEAKALGIRMAQPAYQVADILRQHKVAVFSSNYALYGDISRRVMQTLARFTPHLDVYSIDEAFLRLDGGREDYVTLGQDIQATVRQWTGIPVGIGIATTKTLAKLANHLAKQTGGVVSLWQHPDLDSVLAQIPVEDVWGVGRRLVPKLHAAGFRTALDLKSRGRGWLRRERGIVGERLWLELSGVSCLPLEDLPQPKQAIASTRSFGRSVTCLAELQEALASYASRAGEKLRAGGQLAGAMQVFFHTNRFRGTYREWAEVVHFPEPVNDTRCLAAAACAVAGRQYKEGTPLQKAGVVLVDLVQSSEAQRSLFAPLDPVRSQSLMQAMDRLNSRYGRDTVRLAGTGTRQAWQMKQERRSRLFTTSWQDLPEVI